MIKPVNKLISLTSDNVVTLFGNDIINNAFEEAWKSIVGILTDDSVFVALSNSDLRSDKWSVEDNDGTINFQTDGWTKNKRILSVERKLINTTTYYPAKKLDSIQAVGSVENPDSIYYENNKFRPKYYIAKTGKLKIIPQDVITAGEDVTYQEPKARVYFISYLKFNETSGISDTFDLGGKNFSDIEDNAEDSIFYGIPLDCKELVYVTMAMNLINNYMADFVHEEEDTELTTLLASQLQSLSVIKKEQLQYTMANYGSGEVTL